MIKESTVNSQLNGVFQEAKNKASKARVSKDRDADKLTKTVGKFIREAKRKLKNCEIELDGSKTKMIFSRNENTCTIRVSEVVKGCRIDKRNFNNDNFALTMENVEATLQGDAIGSYESIKNKVLPFIRRKRINYNGCGIGENIMASYYGTDIGDDATAMLGIISDSSITYLREDDLKEWNVSISEVMSQALKNLETQNFGSITKISPGTFFIECDSSNYFLNSMQSSINLNVSGDPVIMIPTSDYILITGKNDIAGQIHILEFAQEIAENSFKPVSSNMYVIVDNAIELFIPNNEIVKDDLQDFKAHVLRYDYLAQNEIIDELTAEHGTEIFSAQYMEAENQKIEFKFSFCTWTDGMDSLIPKTDVIAFSRVNFINGSFECETKMYEWDDVINSSISGLMQKIDSFPVRYRVESFPAPEQLAILKSLEFKK